MVEVGTSTLLLRLLGPPSLVDTGGRTPQGLGWGKPLALLCFLAVRGEARRDEVVDLLWRGVEEDKARNAFRQALHRLRSALGSGMLPQDREMLRLVRSDFLAIDLDRARALESSGQLDDAIQAWHGDFLEGVTLGEPAFDLWAEQERNRLRRGFRATLERAISQATARGDWMRAADHSRRLLASAPFDEDAAELAAATLVSAGQAREARGLLERFSSRLQSELGIAPGAKVKGLLMRLQRQRDVAGAADGAVTLAFVGREPQLAQLLSLWRSVGDDTGALAFVEGGDGAGKTRLVQEFVGHAAALRPGSFLRGVERTHALPLGVFAEALRPLPRATGIAGASPHLLAEAARLLPELRDTLDLPPVADVEDEAARLRFFEGVAALVDAAAYERPVLLTLEDLHHAPPSSLDLLGYLVARLARSPVMFVLTARPDGPPIARLRAMSEPGAQSPAHGERAARIDLAPLTPPAVEEALRPLAARVKLSSRTVEHIVRSSEGIPGRVATLARRIAAGDTIGAAPVSVHELLRQQIEQLPTTHRRLLIVAALLGRPVDLATLGSAAHIAAPACRDAVDDLAAHGLATIDDAGDIVCSVEAAPIVIGLADTDARAFLCRWIAEALSARGDAQSAEVARFFAAAGMAGPAFLQYRRAAFDAFALGASAEGVAFLQLARRFASSAEERDEVEGLLSSFGAGPFRLQGGLPQKRRPDAAPPAATPRWLRLFPNWRLLLGAAVATLLISTVVLWNADAAPRMTGRIATDTLVLAEGEPAHAMRFVTGSPASGFVISAPLDAPLSTPAWIDSTARPWRSALANPRGSQVALVRASASGADVYVVSGDRRDTLLLMRGLADARPLGWSPDGRWVLVSTTRAAPGDMYDSDLFAFSVAEPGRVLAVDSSARRSIVEAEWSPDGSHIAWVARVGENRQLEIFIGRADGSRQVNVSRNPAEDYHIAWSDDGTLLAFTSLRDGNAELYAYGLIDGKTWRLTRNPAQDDWAHFSSGGRFVAFESTRGGAAGVYVMPGLGGEAVRVAGMAPASLLGWRNGSRRYVDAIRVIGPATAQPGDTALLRVAAHDQTGDSIASHSAELTVIGSGASLVAPSDPTEPWKLVAGHSGLVEVVASVPGWRTDTSDVRVGDVPVELVRGSATSGFAEWRALGAPAPRTAQDGKGLALNSDDEWDSGILSRRAVPLLPGLEVSAVLSVREAVWEKASTFGVSLVAPEPASTVDSVAPQFLKYASVTWNAEARRFVYVVGREVFTEEVPRPLHDVAITLVVERDSTIAVSIDGVRRWGSTLRVIDGRNAARVQAWVSSHATGDDLRVREARAELAALRTTTRR